MLPIKDTKLCVNRFIVGKNRLENPSPSRVRDILNRIFEDENDSIDSFLRLCDEGTPINKFELTKTVASTLPKEKALLCWPHIDLDGSIYSEYHDPSYIFSLHKLKSFGTDITEVLDKIIDTCIKKRKFKHEDRDSLKNIFNYIFNQLKHFGTIVGEGFDREKGFNRSTKVISVGKYAIKIPSYPYEWQYTPDLGNWAFMGNKYCKLKTYMGSVLLKTTNLKILESVGEHTQAGISSCINYLDRTECLKYYRETYLKTFSSVPQKSFDDVALDFASLNNDFCEEGKHMHFAFENPNNIILKDDKLYLVDEIIENYCYPNTTSHYLFNMLGIVHQFDLNGRVDYKGAMPEARIIFSKILNASALAKLPPVSDHPSSTNMLSQILMNLKITTPVESVINEFERINKIQDNEARVKAMTEYANKLLEKN